MKLYTVNLQWPTIRWILLLFTLICSFNELYLIDLPMSIGYYLQKVDMHLSSFKYNLLYSISCIPSIFTPFISNKLIEIFGQRQFLIYIWLLIITGQFLMLLGGIYLNFWLLFFGRFFSGIGFENYFIIKFVLLSDWFLNYETSFAFGIIVLGKMGTISVSLISPSLYNISKNLFPPLLFSLLLAILGFIISLVISFFDSKYVKRLTNTADNLSLLEIDNNSIYDQIKNFGIKFWLFFFISCFYFSSFISFYGNSSLILCIHYHFTPQKAGMINCFSLIFVVFGPLFGILSDYFGKRLYFLLSGFIIYFFILFSVLYWPFSNSLLFIPFCLIPTVFGAFGSIYYPCFRVVLNGKNVSLGMAITSSGLHFKL